MVWTEVIGTLSIICLLLCFVILIVVGWANGGGMYMMPWDPALSNKVTTKGMWWVRLAASLFMVSVILALTLILTVA